ELGKRIYENVSKQAWADWMAHQTLLINENRLNPLDASTRTFLAAEMEKFFFEGGSEAPAGQSNRSPDPPLSRGSGTAACPCGARSPQPSGNPGKFSGFRRFPGLLPIRQVLLVVDRPDLVDAAFVMPDHDRIEAPADHVHVDVTLIASFHSRSLRHGPSTDQQMGFIESRPYHLCIRRRAPSASVPRTGIDPPAHRHAQMLVPTPSPASRASARCSRCRQPGKQAMREQDLPQEPPSGRNRDYRPSRRRSARSSPHPALVFIPCFT
ncbi:MAG: oxidative damage protection protein, partial [Burkholderiaceae bacterium]|nr:oxidative damage protection protein [Burkholderiaceae bacterium]